MIFFKNIYANLYLFSKLSVVSSFGIVRCTCVKENEIVPVSYFTLFDIELE